MRLVGEDKSKIVYSDVSGEAVPFSIGDAAFVIGILRDKIYSDPIYAVVSEYLSNAKDACAEIGKDSDQIHVTLPTTLNPTLAIRDFGVGMSPERISDVFVKYGVSTKRQDNTQVGCWGLGCKAAWAYADSFVVVSYYDGICREYIADIGETKEGRLLCYKEVNTDEPDGVMIKVPVQSQDVSEFEFAFVKATMLWDKKPKITNAKVIEYPVLHFEYKGISFYKTYYRQLKNWIFLDASGLPFLFSEGHASIKSYIYPDGLFAVVKANPTKMGISASREGFSNQEYARTLCAKAYSTLTDHIKETLDETPIEKHYSVIREKFMRILSIVRASYYQGRQFDICTGRPVIGISSGYFLNAGLKASFLDSMKRVSNLEEPITYYLTRSSGTRQYSEFGRHGSRREITPLVDPLTKRAITAIKRENSLRRSKGEPTLNINILFQENLPDRDYQDIAKIVGATEYVEDVYGNKKVKIARPRRERRNLKFSMFVASYYKWCSKTEPKVSIEELLNTHEAVFYGQALKSSELKNIVDGIARIVKFNIEFIHVKSNEDAEKLANPKLKPLESLASYIREHPDAEMLADYKLYKKHEEMWVHFLDNDALVLDTCKTFDFKKLREKIIKLQEVVRLHPYMSVNLLEVRDALSLFDKIKKAYPLLDIINEYKLYGRNLDSCWKDLLFYIQKKDELGDNTNA